MTTTTADAETIRDKLASVFDPLHLEVIDESDKHRGHSGWREGGNTHFRVVLRSARFDDLSRVERARAVHAALRDELSQSVHALALDLGGSATPPPARDS